MNTKKARTRRGTKIRARLKGLGKTRLIVHRTPHHIYAQVVGLDGGKVLASASTIEKDVRATLDYTGNITAASHIGQLIAERSKLAGVSQVAFDRAGFKFHGRVKALAEGARSNGLEF